MLLYCNKLKKHLHKEEKREEGIICFNKRSIIVVITRLLNYHFLKMTIILLIMPKMIFWVIIKDALFYLKTDQYVYFTYRNNRAICPSENISVNTNKFIFYI